MGKTNKRKNKKKLIKRIIIGVGIAGISILTIRAIVHRKQKYECRNIGCACEPPRKTIVKPTKKEAVKHDFNREALVTQCNKLLRILWQTSNTNSKLYYDDEVCVDIKACPFPPYISQDV